MGIEVEFNPDLALRAFGTRGRAAEECLPKKLEAGKRYCFLKKGQRNYFFHGEIPLVRTEGYGRLSRPLASIRIIEAAHFAIDKHEEDAEGLESCCYEVWTKGTYEVIEVYKPNDRTIHFEGMNKIED